MLELYTASAPNGRRATIIMEECHLAYRIRNLDLAAGEHKRPAFLALNPIGNVPVLVDPQGPNGTLVTVTQSAAIAIYLATKANMFLPAEPTARLTVLEQLMYVMTDVAAVSTSMFVTLCNNEHSPVLQVFEARMRALLGVVAARLFTTPYLAGDISIADFALYPLVLLPHVKRVIASLAESDGLLAWIDRLSKRPAIQRALAASPTRH